MAATGAAVWAVVALFFSVVPSFATERIGIAQPRAAGRDQLDRPHLLEHLAGSRSRDSIEPRIAQALGLGLLTAGLAALVLASVTDSALALIAASVLAGTGHGFGFLGAQDDLNRIAPPERRGEINAALYTCIYLGVALPVIGVGVLADLTTLTTAVVVFAFVTGRRRCPSRAGTSWQAPNPCSTPRALAQRGRTSSAAGSAARAARRRSPLKPEQAAGDERGGRRRARRETLEPPFGDDGVLVLAEDRLQGGGPLA